jgi:hypothetical protein
MAYTVINFKSKKALKEAFASGQQIYVYQPGPFGPNVGDGTEVIEGPHYPKPHTFYCSVVVKNNIITSIK